jgi:hypothetical protein
MTGALDRQDLQRDGTLKPGVAREIDAAHAAVTQKRNHFIRADTAADVHVHGLTG